MNKTLLQDALAKKLASVTWLLAFTALLVVGAWATYSVFILGDDSVAEENASIENLQNLFLLTASLFSLVSAFFRSKRERAVQLFFAVLFYAFFLREVDFEKLGLAEELVFLFYGTGRNVSVALLFVAVGIYGLFALRLNLRVALAYAFSKRGLLMLIGLLILLSSDMIERFTEFQHEMFYEEGLELLGYFFFLWACVRSFKAKILQ